MNQPSQEGRGNREIWLGRNGRRGGERGCKSTAAGGERMTKPHRYLGKKRAERAAVWWPGRAGLLRLRASAFPRGLPTRGAARKISRGLAADIYARPERSPCAPVED